MCHFNNPLVTLPSFTTTGRSGLTQLELPRCSAKLQKNDCPCILLTGFGFVSCLIKGIILLHLRYIELYSYFITFVWFLLYDNVNCVLFVSPPLNAILYYVLPHQKFPEAFGAQVFKHPDIKRSLKKLMRQLHVSLFMDKL